MNSAATDNDPFSLDKRQVRRSFERAAASYDSAAFLQQEIGDRLVERLDLVRLQPTRVVDIGTGTGHVAAALMARYPGCPLLVSDVAVAMLEHSRRRLRAQAGGWLKRLASAARRSSSPLALVAADAEALPFAGGCADLLVSNLMLQWCPQLDTALSEFRRVLAPGGLLMFTTFGPDTLKELRAAWAEVDAHTHVNAFIDMHDVGDALMRVGFSEPVMDAEILNVTYPEVLPLMKDLKAIGAHHVSAGRRRGMTGRQQLQALAAGYEKWRDNGVLPATYEVIYGHAWVPLEAVSKPVEDGIRVQLDALRRAHG